MIYFTADTHFGHTNIIKYCNRPFSSIEEHDKALVDNWNSVVTSKDTVYHLGDLGFGSSEYIKKIVNKLHGQINFLKGNHDRSSTIVELCNRFGMIKDTHLINVHVNGAKQAIWLSHYAHRTWPKSNHGAWHLWGHSHGNMEPYGLSFDVGVDCWNYTPISVDQVAATMKDRAIILDYNPAE